MPFANLPDAKIHYEWSGAEHLPVLVLCNGLGTNLRMWDRQVAGLFGALPRASLRRARPWTV